MNAPAATNGPLVVCRHCGKTRRKHYRGLCRTCWRKYKDLYRPAMTVKQAVLSSLRGAGRPLTGTEVALAAGKGVRQVKCVLRKLRTWGAVKHSPPYWVLERRRV